MLKQIAHVCIMSNNLAETESFYQELFGLRKLFHFVKGDEVIGFYLGMENKTSIEVFLNTEAASAPHPLINHFCLEVANIDKVIEHVRLSGHEITDKKMGCDNTWQAWINDPSGVRIELFEYTDKSSQFTGEDCLVDW